MKLNRKHLTSILATILLATATHSATAYSFKVSGIYYTIINDTEVCVTNSAWSLYDDPVDYSGVVIIPSTVTHNGTTYSVTAIGGSAFKGCSGLTSITIPNSVTSIDGSAFEGCSGLTSVYITDLAAWCNIEFGNSSGNPLFYAHHLFLNSNEVKDLVFPNSVTSIGNYAFSGCTGLTSVTIPNSITSIGEFAFAYCSSLNSVTIPNSVTSIGNYAFSGCTGLTSVTIPNSVTSIGDSAFAACSSLTSVTIGNSVNHIGGNAFSGTPWYNNQPDGLVYAGLIAYKYKGTMPSGTSITLKDDTKGIAIGAFSGCSGLTSVTIPNSVTSIDRNAFSDCSGLTSVHITDLAAWCNIEFGNSSGNPLFYAHHLFLNSNEVKDLVFPNSVTSIGHYAFSGCSGLTSVSITNSVTKIGVSAFSGCTGLTSVTIPNSVISIGNYAFADCSSLTSVTIPNSITKINISAFSGCTGLTSVTIPNSVTEIDIDAFESCTGLASVHINNIISWCNISFKSITSNPLYFAHHLFLNGEEVKDLVIPNTVSEISTSAFSGCSGLTSVTITNSVTKIGVSAFSGCSGLTSVTIPNTVPEIGTSAFSGCSGLTNLTITGNGSWNKVLSGRNYSDIKTLKVGSEITDISGFGLNPDTVSSYAPVPPTCTGNTFTAYDAELHVPTTSIAAYFTAPYWRNFSNIINNLTEKVMLSQTEDEGIASDEFMLKATTIPADKEDEVVWSTSNPTVATVAEDGKVTLQSKGECRIFASLSSDLAVYASCLVKVNSSIKLDKTEATIAPNEMLVLTPTYDVADIAATSSDASVAIARVVTSDGVKKVQVVGVNYGTATITVASTEGDAPPATCKITVRDTVSSDVNGDGRVNVSDVSALINMILGITPMDQTTGDVNGDGRVNVSDVSALINIILGIQ